MPLLEHPGIERGVIVIHFEAITESLHAGMPADQFKDSFRAVILELLFPNGKQGHSLKLFVDMRVLFVVGTKLTIVQGQGKLAGR